jgi:hypothetical protein
VFAAFIDYIMPQTQRHNVETISFATDPATPIARRIIRMRRCNDWNGTTRGNKSQNLSGTTELADTVNPGGIGMLPPH